MGSLIPPYRRVVQFPDHGKPRQEFRASVLDWVNRGVSAYGSLPAGASQSGKLILHI
jgi:hypothetical protein